MEHQSKFNGQKIVSGSVKNGGLGEVENSIFTPKDARVTLVVLKSILKNKLQSHGFIYQPYVNNEKIDKVAGSERRVNFKEKIGSGKASKIDCLAAADNRKITFEIDATGIEDKDMENNTISKLRDQNGETKKLKNNVEIGKAASKGKTIKNHSSPDNFLAGHISPKNKFVVFLVLYEVSYTHRAFPICKIIFRRFS